MEATEPAALPCEPGMFSLPLRAAEMKDPTVFRSRILSREHTLDKFRAAPHQLAVMNLLGVLSFHNGHRLQAIQWFDKALELDPQNLNAIANKLFVYQRLLSAPEKAQACADTLVELCGPPADRTRDHTKRQARCFAEQAYAISCELIVGKRDLPAGNRYYDRALGLGFRDVDREEQMIWKFNIARNNKRMCLDEQLPIQERQQLFVESVKIFDQIISEPLMSEFHGSCWCNLGHMIGRIRMTKLFQTGEMPEVIGNTNVNLVYEDQEPCFRKAIELEPDYFKHYVYYARYLMFRRRYPDALARVNRALELEPGEINVFGFSSRGHITIQACTKEPERNRAKEMLLSAAEDLTYVQQLQPAAGNLSRLGTCYYQLARDDHQYIDKALECFLNAVEFPGGGKDPTVHCQRRRCLREFSALEHAAESFKRVLETDSRNNKFGNYNLVPLMRCLLKMYVDGQEKKSHLSEVVFWFNRGYCQYSKDAVARTITTLTSDHSESLLAMCRQMRDEKNYWKAARFCLETMAKGREPEDDVTDLLEQVRTCSPSDGALRDVSADGTGCEDGAQDSSRETSGAISAGGPSTKANEHKVDTLKKPLERARNSRQLPYDFFVIHSHEDAEWVNYSLLPKLERVYGFKGLIADRDFHLGHSIIENIASAIVGSVCSLVVLTPSFVRSRWCEYELENAIKDSVTKGRVIPVKLHECDVPSALSRITYLDATEICDWERLRRDIEELM